MASFSNTTQPTPFGVYDSDLHFIEEADSIVLYVKRRLGDDVLSVELTSKQIWANFEEATLKLAKVKETNNSLHNSVDNSQAEIEVLNQKIADLQESHSEADRYAVKWRSNKQIFQALLEEKIADVDNFG